MNEMANEVRRLNIEINRNNDEFEIWWNKTEGLNAKRDNEYYHNLLRDMAQRAWLAARE